MSLNSCTKSLNLGEEMTTISIALKPDTKETLANIANTIRGLAMDAVERAGSGHAGTPMGCADIAAYLYGCFLRYNPQNTHWVNRDRFILSAGHASLLQYSCLHFAGILSIEELKQFRQLNSRTPSHPQYRTTPAIETTTGVDGQGISHGVGQALGIKMLGERFNRPPFSLYNAKVVVLAGDGCLMEGVSHEACSLAGHWRLDNLILIYDRNKTCLDGVVSDSSSEDTRKRYEGYGWEVYEIDGHDFDAFDRIFSRLRNSQSKPALIVADTIIGKGAPKKAGSYLIHSDPLGREEISQAKKDLGLPESEFYVDESVYAFFQQKNVAALKREAEWNKNFEAWKKKFPDLHSDFQKITSQSQLLFF
jgi:transketolase